MANIPIEAQIACIRREITRLADTTPERIATGATSWPVARYEQEAMTAILQTLLDVLACRYRPGVGYTEGDAARQFEPDLRISPRHGRVNRVGAHRNPHAQ